MKRVLGFLLLIAASGACSSDNTVTTPTAQLVISLAAAQVTATRGGHIVVAAEVTRENATGTAPVVVTVSAPTGLTASVGGATTTGNTTTVSISITVGSTTLPGTYSVGIHAAATGFPDAATSVAVDVN